MEREGERGKRTWAGFASSQFSGILSTAVGDMFAGWDRQLASGLAAGIVARLSLSRLGTFLLPFNLNFILYGPVFVLEYRQASPSA